MDDGRELVEIVARALCLHGEPTCWETHMADAVRALTAIEASGRWKIVPVEPSEWQPGLPVDAKFTDDASPKTTGDANV
jgi:hypothetical protein